jgi:hypothetical protein
MDQYVVAENKKYNTLYISERVWNDSVCLFLYKKGFIFRVIKEEDLHKEGFVILYNVCTTKVVLYPKIHTINYKMPIIRYFTELNFYLNNLQLKPT